MSRDDLDRHNQHIEYLLAKRALGRLTPAEVETLRDARLLIGGDGPTAGTLALPVPCRSVEEWTEKYVGKEEGPPGRV